LPDGAAVAAIAAAAGGIMAHCNGDHGDAMAVIAGHAGAGMAGARMVAVDVDGCDIASGERVVRVAWRQPVADAMGVRTELVRLAQVARSRATTADS
jgi:putative heme iron utilization protein